MPRWIKVQSVRVSHPDVEESFIVEVMYNGPTKDKPKEGGQVKIKLPKKEEWIDIPSYIDPEIFGFSPRHAPFETIAYLRKNFFDESRLQSRFEFDVVNP